MKNSRIFITVPEKQLSWAAKASFDKETMSEKKIFCFYVVFSLLKAVYYFWEIVIKLTTAIFEMKIEAAIMKTLKRTKKLFHNFFKANFMKNMFQKNVPLLNALPDELKRKKPK